MMIGSTHWRKLRDDRLILPFYLPSLILSFSQGLLIPVLPLYATGFEVSYGIVGLILAAQSVGNLIGDIPSGMLLQRMGQKAAMALGLAGTALTMAGLFWAKSVSEVLLYLLVSGFSNALYNIARHAYITDAIGSGNRGRATALLGGLFRLGRFFGPMIGGLLAGHYGLRVPFLWFGGACLASVVVVMLFVEGDGRATLRAKRLAQPEPHLLAVLKARVGLLVAGGTGHIFAQMIRAGRSAIIPLFAADVIGLDVEAIGLLTTIAAGVEMTLFYPAGWIMDHWGRKAAIVPSFAFQAIAMACVPFTRNFGGLLFVTTLIGLGNGLSSGAMLTLGSDLAPKGARGGFLGVWRFIGDIGSTGGPVVVGGVADLVELPTAAWAMAAAGLLAAGIFGFLLPETLERPPRAVAVAEVGND
jgi:MFS family permease